MRKNTVILIDGMNLAWRAYHSHKNLQTSAGVKTGVTYGFMRLLQALVKWTTQKRLDSCPIIVCWEGGMLTDSGFQIAEQTWRKSIKGGDAYKGNREITRDTIIVHKQVAHVMEVLDILGYRQVSVPTLEADDVIGVLSAALEKRPSVARVLIYSNDKDYYQCLSEKTHVLRADFKMRTLQIVTPKDVKQQWGVTCRNWAKFRSLCGDSSDRIPGIRGVGPVNAKKLIDAGLDPSRSWKNQLDSVRKELREYEQHWPTARMCWHLSKIPRRADYKLFPKAAAKALASFVKDPDSLCLTRCFKTKRDKAEAMRRFTAFCSTFELVTFLAERRSFFV